MTFLASGIAFLALALGGQDAFYGVAMSMLTLGVVFLAKGRGSR